jgi:hypothetical protein
LEKAENPFAKGSYPVTTIFFVTDLYGSDTCWSKFLGVGKFHGVKVFVFGGMTGEAIVHQGRKTIAPHYLKRCLTLRINPFAESALSAIMKLTREV